MISNMPRYAQMKDSGVEWLGEIPVGWQVRKVTHTYKNIGSGTTPSSANSSYYDGDINWLQTGDLTDGLITNTSRKISHSALKMYSSLKLYPCDSVVIAMYGATIGKVGLLKIETTTNQACCVLVGSKHVLSEYSFYQFQAFKPNIISMAYGGGQPNISQELLRNLRLPLPPLPEQTAISTFIDQKTAKIDQAIALKQKQIELFKERKQLVIQQAVTKGLNPHAPMRDSGVEWIGEIPEHWKVKRAKYLFIEIDDRSESGQEELLSVSHMTGVTPRSEKNVSMFMAEDYTGSKTCQSGDLIFNIMWAWMGALGVADRRGIISPSYGVFRQSKLNTFNMKYLEFLLKTVGYVEHYNKVSTGLHSSRLRFYSHMFFTMKIGFPQKNEQDDIVTHIETQSAKIDKAIDIQQQQINKLKEYKATLINSAVTGKIKVF